MKAILLAAGRGTRISRMIENIPKCTLPIGKRPLIRCSVECLIEKGFDVAVCVGYKYHHIEKALKDLPVTYFYNPFFEVTNSLASLWLARSFIDGDCLICNADVYWTEQILEDIINSPYEAVLAIDKKRKSVGDYFFQTANECIKKYGKDLPIEERSGEYVGMAKITKEFVPLFVTRMQNIIERQGYDKWWEEVLYSFTDDHDIHAMDVHGEFWAEVDYYDDYERILTYINKLQSENSN